MPGIRSRSCSIIESIVCRTWGSGSAPLNSCSGCPPTTATTIGIDCTPNAWAIRGFASTSTLARIQVPPPASASRSSTGDSCLHGPHHSAHRSTTTGTSSERSSTSAWNVSSVTSMTHCPVGAAEASAAGAFARAAAASDRAFTAARSTAPAMVRDSAAVWAALRGSGRDTPSILARHAHAGAVTIGVRSGRVDQPGRSAGTISRDDEG